MLKFSSPPIRFITFILAAIGLSAPALAQVTVSNLSEALYGNGTVDFNNWRASSFTTDSSSYTLDAITLRIAYGSGGALPAAFVGIYSDSFGVPGAQFGALTGSSNPTTANDYIYNPASTITLGASTTYWIVAGESSNDGSTYAPRITASVAESNTGGATWLIGNNVKASGNQGSSWSNHTNTPLYLSVTATAVPEPSTYAALAGVIALGLAVVRRRKMAA
jgi:hypothetical protein